MKTQITLSLFLGLFFLAPDFEALAPKTATVATKSVAQTEGTWESIGTVTAARIRSDHDVITMPEPYVNYTKLKLKVTSAPINIKKLVINYENGESQTITNRYEVKKGEESNIINLKSGSKKLQSVEMWYDTQGLMKGKAKVTLMGLKSK